MDQYSYVRSLLVRRKIRNKDVAEQACVTASCVSRVLHNHAESRNVKQVVADLLGMKYEKLWGKAA